MKFTITFEVPDGTIFRVEPDEETAYTKALFARPESAPGYVPPFEDELIPLPPEVVPIAGDPPAFRAPQTRVAEVKAAMCPTHHQTWKLVPEGVSKKTGRPYSAFYACPVRGCDQRPSAA